MIEVECGASLGICGGDMTFTIEVDEDDVRHMSPDGRQRFVQGLAKQYAIDSLDVWAATVEVPDVPMS